MRLEHPRTVLYQRHRLVCLLQASSSWDGVILRARRYSKLLRSDAKQDQDQQLEDDDLYLLQDP